MSTQASTASNAPPPPPPEPTNEQEAKELFEKAVETKDEDSEEFTPLSRVGPDLKGKFIDVIGIVRDIGTPILTKRGEKGKNPR
jgi:hypothetical protein